MVFPVSANLPGLIEASIKLSKEKKPWLFRGFLGDEILPSYEGIISNHYRDRY